MMTTTWTPALAASSATSTEFEADARRQVVEWIQALVDGDSGEWWVNDYGQTEVHLVSGEILLLGEHGITRR